jgi:hypothetical protein
MPFSSMPTVVERLVAIEWYASNRLDHRVFTGSSSNDQAGGHRLMF